MSRFFKSAPAKGAGHYAPFPAEPPFPAIHDDLFHHPDGTLTAVHRIQPCGYEFATTEEVDEFVTALRAVINSMEPGVRMRIVHRVTRVRSEDIVAGATGRGDSTCERARTLVELHNEEVLRGRQVLRENLLVALSFQPRPRSGRRGAGTAVVPAGGEMSFVPPAYQARCTEALDLFERAVSGAIRAMRALGLDPQQLRGPELLEVARQTLGVSSGGQRPVQRDLTYGRGKACVGERQYAAVSLRHLPDEVWAGMGSWFAGLPFPCMTSIDVVMVQKHATLAEQRQDAEAHAREARAPATIATTGTLPPPPYLAAQPDEEAAEPSPGERLRALARHENPVIVTGTVLVEGADTEELAERCGVVEEMLSRMSGASGSRTMDGEAVAAQAAAASPLGPIGATEEAGLRSSTSAAAALLPTFGRWQGCEDPMMLQVDRHGRMVGHAPFPKVGRSMNRNRVVAGTSGTGKSFGVITHDVVPTLAMPDGEVLVIECGGGYSRVAEHLGGAVCRPGPQSRLCINVMDLPADFDHGTPEEQAAELDAALERVTMLILAMVGDDNLRDRSLWAGSDRAAYRSIAKTVIGHAAKRAYADAPRPRLRDVYRWLGRHEGDAADPEMPGWIRTLMREYVVDEDGVAGAFAKYFDGPTTAATSGAFGPGARFLVVDLVDVKNEAFYQPMVVAIVQGLFGWRLRQQDGRRRLIVFDESWSYLQYLSDGAPSTASLAVESLWREAGRLGASCIAVCQSIEELDGVSHSALLENAGHVRCHLHERRLAADYACLGAPTAVGKILYELKANYGRYAEVAVRGGNQWAVARQMTSPRLYWLATSDPLDLALLGRYREEHGEGYLEKIVIDHPGGAPR